LEPPLPCAANAVSLINAINSPLAVSKIADIAIVVTKPFITSVTGSDLYKDYLVIPRRHSELIRPLRTAWATELSLNKKQTSYSDLLDGLRLSLKAYNFE
jgi:hypothetical protein